MFVIATTTWRLGLLQAVGVVATSYALVTAIDFQGGSAFASMGSKASPILAAAIVARLAPTRSSGWFLIAVTIGMIGSTVTYTLMAGIPEALPAKLLINGLVIAAFAVGISGPDNGSDG